MVTGICRTCGAKLEGLLAYENHVRTHEGRIVPEWVRRAQERRLPAVDTSGLVRMGGAL